MDWISIIVTVLVFVLPVLLENGRKKKRRKLREEVRNAEQMDAGPVEVKSPEPVVAPVVEHVHKPLEVQVSEAPEKGPVQPERPRPSRRRINARDMVIYSEILHPKYLEKRENL
ncbi:MAG TPA: hypothetical protein IAC04_08420 [Candidatus Coprenecus stercoravium]|uniref:Uncharacterized protein n=1 Tax=Candidatus Coprenecus stercoravium TaxID=2840735 RepID=A0A9D2GQT8_9BACT|nr:hypothetical protein [Candidatus Coprenecus stercoravium]